MRNFLSPLVVAFLATAATHDAVLPVNPQLGVPGFPDCVRRNPTVRMGIEEASLDLECGRNTAPAGAIRIACVGDSITAGVHSSGSNHAYPQQLQMLLDTAHGNGTFAVTNLGACGSTMLKKGNSPFWERPQYTALAAGKWDIVTIMLGTNDAKDPGSKGPNNWQHDCGGVDATTLSNCSFASDYHDMIELVKTLGTTPGVAPKIYTLVPPPLMQLDAYGMNQTVINSVYPKLIPLIAQANEAAVSGMVDMFTPMGGELQWATDPTWPKLCAQSSTLAWPACGWYCDAQSCDQCHPNDSGYAHMANVLKAGLGL
jgi:acyl-CoA thioesterase-1